MTDQQIDMGPEPGWVRALPLGFLRLIINLLRFWGRAMWSPHFLVAFAIIVLTAGGWQLAVSALELVTEKLPVPWPAGVEVNDKYVMTAMSDRMGPFEFVSADGELDFDPKTQGFRKDGLPDGEGEVAPDVMELLGVGTATDARNLPLRRSNWLSMRTYRDSRKPAGDPLRYWRLEVDYYTGGVDLVPHTPERCIVAGGGQWLGTTGLPVTIDDVEAPWGNTALAFQRALFQRTDMQGAATGQFVQYYIFCLNGSPKSGRNEVRFALGSLFVKHAYFAKIQFAPVPAVQQAGGRLVYAIADPAQADLAAADFVKHFMPHVLKTLPTPKDIERLDAGAGGEKAGSRVPDIRLTSDGKETQKTQ